MNCPFCGSDRHYLQGRGRGHEGPLPPYYIECDNCKAVGPLAQHAHEARGLWDAQVASPLDFSAKEIAALRALRKEIQTISLSSLADKPFDCKAAICVRLPLGQIVRLLLMKLPGEEDEATPDERWERFEAAVMGKMVKAGAIREHCSIIRDHLAAIEVGL